MRLAWELCPPSPQSPFPDLHGAFPVYETGAALSLLNGPSRADVANRTRSLRFTKAVFTHMNFVGTRSAIPQRLISPRNGLQVETTVRVLPPPRSGLEDRRLCFSANGGKRAGLGGVRDGRIPFRFHVPGDPLRTSSAAEAVI